MEKEEKKKQNQVQNQKHENKHDKQHQQQHEQKNNEQEVNAALKAEVETLYLQKAALNDKLLRISADMQNMKRRFEEERSNLLMYDGEKFIKELLPIVDNFERALKLDNPNLTEELSKFLAGFKLIYGQLISILQAYGVQEIECIDKEFDPSTMEAVMVDTVEGKPMNTVIDCMQKGYMYKDKVLRVAMVKVNK
jgi:molecular chaperone GrpE